MKNSRSRQVTHSRRFVGSLDTVCGRTIAGSMEIDNLRPTCPRCCGVPSCASRTFRTPAALRDPRDGRFATLTQLLSDSLEG